ALTTFGITKNITEGHLPCVIDRENNLPRTINQLHNAEHIWKNIASYIELVFQFHLGSLFNLLRIDIGFDYSLRTAESKQKDAKNESDSLIKEVFTICSSLNGYISAE
uniref:Uncharacterized protein n=1 Tax=Parascaris equorum TaxID=6256 RepID=A0A914S2U6_PAREQ